MNYLIKNASVVNEGEINVQDVLIENNIISKIERNIQTDKKVTEINAEGLFLLPGLIDDQVHFREPGLTHKGEIYTEAKAAVAGGVTSFMEMPNTNPTTTTKARLEEKYTRASQCSLANYSFFMGTTNTNLDEILSVDYSTVCGLKIFMGSSTGDMLVDNSNALENVFSKVNTLIATHCENDPLIKQNQQEVIAKYGEDLPAYFHPIIRNNEACFKSSSFAVELAKKFNTRLHILHISTAKELSLFTNKIPLKDKRITSEACIHHLWFSDEDYAKKGNYIKWNPSVKTTYDRDKVFEAVLNDTIDVIATDHAPHTIEEKELPYLKAPSGGPLVQHSLLALLDLMHNNKITLTKIAQKTSHNVADLFAIKNRGFIREGYFADLVLVNLNKPTLVNKQQILYKCGWSPFEGHTFKSSIEKTFVNGNLVFNTGEFNENYFGSRLLFNR
ncbi:MAG: dihydroorotase [Bacteroidetes bacterium]|uniref:dihydroorotase n=1 Tax=Flavobacterium filum TaxID=370974 RepID=UPI0023F39511|nr:dihydroorotase [Flavobacterium filum]MCA0429399.1 dihydroorotase [Bacteroidota bacterium]